MSEAAKAISSSAAARAVARSGAPKCATSCCASASDRGARGPPRSPRRSAPAWTSRATRCRGTPPRKAERALPSRLGTSAFQNTNAPDTAHSPGSAARSKTKVSDGSRRMVRISFTSRGPRVAGSSQDGAPSARQQLLRSTSTLPHAAHQQIAVLVDVAAHALVRAAGAADIPSRPRAKPCSLPGIDVHHQMAREALDQRAGAEIGEAFLLQRGDQRIEARLALAHRHGADHGAEHQPVGRRHPRSRLRGQASRPPPTSPPSTRIASGQSIAIGFSGGACAAQRVDQRHHADIERAPRGAQRLLGLQHHGEFGQVEAPDIDERAGAVPRPRCVDRMHERVADLAQRHQRERRRQVEFRREAALRGSRLAASLAACISERLSL